MATKNNTTKTADPGLSKKTKTILISAAGGLSTYGVVLQLQDDDDKGADDEIGGALIVTSEVFRKVASGKTKPGRDEILRAIADGIYMRLGIDLPE